MSDPKIVMCGCHEAGLPLIKGLLKDGINFSHFVTLSPELAEKNNVSGYADFSALASEHGIPIYYCKSYTLKDPQDQEFFQQQSFDVLIQGGWQRLFPDEVINTFSVGAIGVHGSPDFLPKGRGRSPLNWSLIEDESRFIMQVFLIQPGIDDGPVFDSETFDINQHDTIKTLYYKNAIVTQRMIIRSLSALLDGSIVFRPQVGEPSYYPRRSPADGKIDWEGMNVSQIYNFIRAQTKPYPGAFGLIDGAYHKIWQAQIFDTRITYSKAKYGEIVERFGSDIIINCRGGLLLIAEYEPISPNEYEILGIKA